MDDLDRQVLRFIGTALKWACLVFAWPVVLPYWIFQGLQRARHERSRLQRERQESMQKDTERRGRALAERRQREITIAEGIRRESARASCELLYEQHAPEIQRRFSRDSLERLMQTYMTDAQSVEAVERYAIQLQHLIESHRQRVDPSALASTPATITELAGWYLTEKSRIDGLPVDDTVKQLHQIQLENRYAELSEDLLQRAHP